MINVELSDEKRVKRAKRDMKSILNLEGNCDIDELRKIINDVCKLNFAHLTVIQQYLFQISGHLEEMINELISSNIEERIKLCRQYYKSDDFHEIEIFIFMQRIKDILYDLPSDGVVPMNRIQQEVFKYKKIQLALAYNILTDNDEEIPFVRKDICYNLPQLIYWVKRHKNFQTEQLSDDETEIIAGYIYGLERNKMISNLSFSEKFTANQINETIKNLPRKLGVNNMTQAIFKILLLKPYFWSKAGHTDIVKSIKKL